jgi:hypothetical protein
LVVVPKVVVIRAITQRAVQPHVITVAAKLVTLQTVWAHASKTLFTQTGLAMAIAMMVHIFRLIMDMADLKA